MAKSLAEQFVDSAKKVGVSGNIVQDLLDRGYAVEEAKTSLFEMRVNIRESLRSLDGAGALTKEQTAELAELYPPRERRSAEEEEAAATTA